MDVDFDVVTLASVGPWIRTTQKLGQPAPLPSRKMVGPVETQRRIKISVVGFGIALGYGYAAYAACRTLQEVRVKGL